MSKSLVEEIHEKIEAKLAERSVKQDELDVRMSAIEAEKRDANEDEQKDLRSSIEAIKAIDEEVKELEVRESELKEMQERRDRAAQLAKEYGTKTVSVKEPLTYRSDNMADTSFLTDAYRSFRYNDPDAAQRLSRHNAEMRDIGTSAFAGLTVPQFLTDMAADVARAGRPLADKVAKHQIPAEGETISLSRLTTGTAVASQATQNSAVQETNADDTKLDISLVTIAGQQDLSVQSIERSRGAEALIFQDLVKAYHSELDRQIIHGDGTSGTHLGIQSTSGIGAVTYTDASPTVAELYLKLADAIQRVSAGIFAPANCIVMAPRRWGWFLSSLDTTNRPLVVPNAYGSTNAAGVGQTGYAEVGTIMGIPVVTDGNISLVQGAGTEDTIIVTRTDELHLWEENNSPLALEFKETGSATLSVKALVRGYSFFTAGRRPTASSVISGTGLIAPTF